jgi:hypothetical protein
MAMPPGGYAAPPPPPAVQSQSTKAFHGPEARIAVAQAINGGLGLLGMYVLTGAIIIGVFFAVLFALLAAIVAVLAALNGFVSWIGAGSFILGLFVLAVLTIGIGYMFGAKWATP